MLSYRSMLNYSKISIYLVATFIGFIITIISREDVVLFLFGLILSIIFTSTLVLLCDTILDDYEDTKKDD